MSKSFVNIVPIGSSSSGNSLYININDVGFLIDAGVCYSNIIKRIEEINYRNIDAIFVTHTHTDHISNILAVHHKTNARVYASLPVCDYLKTITNKEALDYFYKKEIIKGLKVTMIKTYHDTKGPCGFVFEKDGVKIGYVTDTGMITKQMLNILKGSQIVVMESNHDIYMLEHGPYPVFLQERIKSNVGHLSNEQCSKTCRWLSENGTKHFFLAHLSEENNKPELAYEETSKALDNQNNDIYVLPKYNGEIKTFEIEEETELVDVNKNTYNYCLVKIENKDSKFWYLDEKKIHKTNDQVIVPLGKKNKLTTGTIVEIVEYKEDALPFPLEDTKRII